MRQAGAQRASDTRSPPEFGDAFRDRSVLVTGHTGFKGSWLGLWLHRLGASVTGLALDPPTQPSNFEASRVAGRLAADIRADVRDPDAVADAVGRAAPDVVFHLAGQPIVRVGLEDPRGTFDTNVMGTVNVLDAVRLARRPCVVVAVTSDKCYEHHEHTAPHPETDRLGGTEPYGTSKAAAELVVAAYRSTFFPVDRLAVHGVRVASARAGNVIGGGDWAPDRILPDTVRSLAEGRAVPVRFPEAVRPWQHVLEPLSGYLLLAARLLTDAAPGELCAPFNFGPAPSDEVPVRSVVEAAIDAWGAGTWTSVEDPTRHHEAATLRLLTDAARTRLGWVPRWGFTDAVGRAVAWYRTHDADPAADMSGACWADIDAYEAAGRVATATATATGS